MNKAAVISVIRHNYNQLFDSAEERGLDYTSPDGIYESMEYYIRSGVDNPNDDIDDSVMPLVVLYKIIELHNGYHEEQEGYSTYHELEIDFPAFILLSSVEEYLEQMGTWTGARLRDGELIQVFKEWK